MSPTRLLNRRQFLLGALLVLQIPSLGNGVRYQRFTRAFSGFLPLSLTQFANLQLGHTETPIALSPPKVTEAGTWEYQFSLKQESVVCLSASADSAPTVFLHPLIVHPDGQRRLLLPLLRSDIPGKRLWADIVLGRMPAGDYSFLIAQDASVIEPIPDSLQVIATRLDPDSLMSKFIEHGPSVGLKNEANVLDDIPLISFATVQRHPRHQRYLISHYLIFSSENGGTMPVPLHQQYQRTTDIELVIRLTADTDGQVDWSQVQFQAEHHQIRPFAGGEILDGSPVVAVATANNNFSDGRIHVGSFSLPAFEGKPSQGILYRGKPVLYPSFFEATSLMAKNPEMQRWSEFELAQEQCVDLSNLADPQVIEFNRRLSWIKQRLSVSFPNRGCGMRKLGVTPSSDKGV